MRKLSKKQTQNTLHKKVLKCSENELRFIFHLFSFDLKEFKKRTGEITFEVHYKTTFIVRIRITDEIVMFINEWINFGQETVHGVTKDAPPCIGALVVLFVNLFFAEVLQRIGYNIMYNENWSVFDSLEEAQEYLQLAQATMVEIVKPLNETKE